MGVCVRWEVYSTRPSRVGCGTRLFKRFKAGLNPAFSFSFIGCCTKVKEPSLSHYLYTVDEGGVEYMDSCLSLVY